MGSTLENAHQAIYDLFLEILRDRNRALWSTMPNKPNADLGALLADVSTGILARLQSATAGVWHTAVRAFDGVEHADAHAENAMAVEDAATHYLAVSLLILALEKLTAGDLPGAVGVIEGAARMLHR